MLKNLFKKDKNILVTFRDLTEEEKSILRNQFKCHHKDVENYSKNWFSGITTELKPVNEYLLKATFKYNGLEYERYFSVDDIKRGFSPAHYIGLIIE